MTLTLYVGNDNLLELTGAYDQAAGEYINDATVHVTSIVNDKGAAVGGQSLPIAFTYVAGSNGDYRAVLDDAQEYVSGGHYEAVVDLDAGSGKKAKWRLKLFATDRRK